jgi:4-amino-4-deoxy-L-arabinose transferase-like glycosyltransferase
MRLARNVPLAGWICAAVAVLNAACWALITPPFQVPDEPPHFAYVKQLAKNHRLPTTSGTEYTHEEEIALGDLGQGHISLLPPSGTIASLAQQHKLERDLTTAAHLPLEGSRAAGVANSQPPLYYLLETIPYGLGSEGNLLARLTLMRLFSSLFAGFTAMFVFLFLREALPGTRALWAACGLGIAFAPLLGFMSGAVNPDSLLFAVSAALFWSLARAFRLGLTYRRAALIGTAIAVGLLTKLNFIGLLPGAILGLGVLALRMARSSRAGAARAFGLGIGIAIGPLVLLGAVDLATSQTLGTVSSSISSTTHHGSILAALSYTWQLFLPRLPGMQSYDPGLFTTRQIWFDGFVGQYGWVETAFPGWVYDVALVPAIAILVACGRTLVTLRGTILRRWAELLVYAVMGLGTAAIIGGAAYFFPSAGSFTQARYLLPLLPLFAAVLGLAVKGVGRRWEAVAGAALVTAMMADDIFSQLLVISRYYG